MVITDKKVLTKYVSAFVMGDGCLFKDKNENSNARYRLTQVATHRDYVEWQAAILDNLCATKIYENDARIDASGWNHQKTLALQTRSLPFFTTLRNRWYLGGKKVVSPHDLLLMDAEFLAILYMDDGCLVKNSGRNRTNFSIVLCTQSFSWADNNLIRDTIARKFNLHFNIKQLSYPSGIKYQLYCKQKFVPEFISIVAPYILPSFQYKIQLPNEQLLKAEDEEIV